MTPLELRSHLDQIRSALQSQTSDMFRLQAADHHLDRLIAELDADEGDSLADAVYGLIERTEDKPTAAVLGCVWLALVDDDVPRLARALEGYICERNFGLDVVLREAAKD